MNEKHVTSLVLSKKLKELGVPQESEFYWVTFDNSSCVDTPNTYKTLRFTQLYSDEEMEELKEKNHIKIIKKFSAFLASEIAEMLPAGVKEKRLQLDKMPKGEWLVSYVPFVEDNKEEIVRIDESIPDALGSMLAYLKEQKLI